MTIKKVLSEIKKGDYEYVDMRFTDPRGKLQHVTVMASEVDEGFLKSGWMTPHCNSPCPWRVAWQNYYSLICPWALGLAIMLVWAAVVRR